MAGPTTVGPGNTIAASDINQLVNILALLYGSGIVLNGATAGTATLYQFFVGTLKVVVVYESGFRNGGGSAQTIAIPTPFVDGCFFLSSATGTFELLASASSKNVSIVTTLASGGGTATTSSTGVGSFSFGDCQFPIDTVSFNGSVASNHTGFIILIGI